MDEQMKYKKKKFKKEVICDCCKKTFKGDGYIAGVLTLFDERTAYCCSNCGIERFLKELLTVKGIVAITKPSIFTGCRSQEAPTF